jgi:hypothetical protein
MWGSIAAVSVVAMFFFLCLGNFVWTSADRNYLTRYGQYYTDSPRHES